MRSCKPACSSGRTHPQIHNHHPWTPPQPHPMAAEHSSQTCAPNPVRPTLGTLQNQLSTLPCIFKPKFLPSKHKRPPSQPQSLTVKQKTFVFGRDIKHFVYTCCFPFFLSHSSIPQFFPIQSVPCSTKYCLCQSGLHVFILQRP